MTPKDLRNKRVTVIGLGNSGFNAAMLLCDIGADVWATDAGSSEAIRRSATELASRGAHVETGGHTEAFVKGSALVVVSPGVESSSSAIRWAEKGRIPVIGEMELGSRYCKGHIIAITGTNGKSTVTTLIGDILKSGGKDAVVCGNIGNSLCGEIARIKKDSWVVLEVSSFQLERIESFKPHISVILNITDDHMDRYSTFREYYDEKLKIFRNQDARDYLILNYDAVNLRALKNSAKPRTVFYSRLEKTDGSFLEGADAVSAVSGKPVKILSVSDIPLKGVHNVENVLACALAGMLAGVKPDDIRNAVKKFKGLHHRVETVGVVDGVEYIDDSKGTTVDSTKRALESFDEPVVLIAGGRDKNSDYGAIKDTVKERVKHLVVIGEASSRIRQALGGVVETHRASDMFDAVRISRGLAKTGMAVLLSPMCSSFDMFRDYKHRGEVFKEAVLGLVKEKAAL